LLFTIFWIYSSEYFITILKLLFFPVGSALEPGNTMPGFFLSPLPVFVH
jgi:hypothetical protein